MKVGRVAIAAVLAGLLAGSAVGARAQPAPIRIGVVLKDLDNPFFVAMFEGITAEARRRDVPVTVRAATSTSDLAGQAAHVRALVASGHDCYAVNPITTTNVVAALRGVKRPIVNIDSPIDPGAAKDAGVRIRTYIGTNDVAAGGLAGARMASLLRGRRDVALVAGLADSVNSRLRLKGFEQGLRGTGVRVVVRVVADYDRVRAQIAAERILRSHPRISGFFAANDLMALGIADALRAEAKSGTVAVIGVDGIVEALEAVRAGTMSATVSQYPYVMGQMAVEACIAVTRGANVPPRVDAPIALVTKANVARARAAFPRPFRRYSDPFERILRNRR